MLASNTTVFGIYPDFVTLRASVDSLKALGFRDDDISLLFPERAVSRTLPMELEAPAANFGENPGEIERQTEPGIEPEIEPEIEPLIGGNLSFLTYIQSAGAGTVSGALTYLGVPTAEAERYECRIRNGEVLVGVRSESTNQAELATEVLVETGAANVSAASNSLEEFSRPSKRAKSTPRITRNIRHNSNVN
jgi:hypothetical protein